MLDMIKEIEVCCKHRNHMSFTFFVGTGKRATSD